MVNASFSYFDFGVLGIMGLSCLFACFRGFIREILSLGAWVGAGLVTLYYFPSFSKMLAPHFKSPVGAAGIATLIIYVGALLAFSLLNMLIIRILKEGEEVGFLDNALGLFFGAFRGAFIICLAYMLTTMVMTEDEFPPWVKNARTRPIVEKGAIMLARAAPQYLAEVSSLKHKVQSDGEEGGGIHIPSIFGGGESGSELTGSSGGGSSDTKVVHPMTDQSPSTGALPAPPAQGAVAQ